jgi:hypothetical protein
MPYSFPASQLLGFLASQLKPNGLQIQLRLVDSIGKFKLTY